MAGALKRQGPAHIANAAADVLTTPAAGHYFIVTHIQVINKTGGGVTYTVFLGGTGGSIAGTEIMGGGTLAAGAVDDRYLRMPVANTEYISAVAGAATSLTIEIEYEHHVSSV